MQDSCSGTVAVMAKRVDRPLYGKFRGVVVDNVDPLGLGRATVEVHGVGPTGWALPCAPFGGPSGEALSFSAPPPGTNVWVEFERGDPDHPVWVGVFPDGV